MQSGTSAQSPELAGQERHSTARGADHLQDGQVDLRMLEDDARGHVEALAVRELDRRREWLADLSRQYLRYLPDQTAVPEIETVNLDALTNALIMSLNLDIEEKQRLLEMNDVVVRAEEIGNELSSRIESLRFLAPYRRATDPTQN